MNVLVFSDLHGIEKCAIYMQKAIDKYAPEMILILGDIDSKDSTTIVDLIRKYSGFITAVSGNCDYPGTDEDIYNIKLPYYASANINGHTAHLSHVCQFVSFPPGDIVMYGHTHIKDLRCDRGVFYLNPGSLGLPRDGSSSFALIDDSGISLIDSGSMNIIQKLDF